ncbi:hypothetical protein RA265_28565, partial [Pseudomonas syringae pv. tagetis]|uniref:hypothetical protein n=1 Tax=Pseudomonas syringae group genomosp. 7 TaxID=251699 RepID=UPI0037707847
SLSGLVAREHELLLTFFDTAAERMVSTGVGLYAGRGWGCGFGLCGDAGDENIRDYLKHHCTFAKARDEQGGTGVTGGGGGQYGPEN